MPNVISAEPKRVIQETPTICWAAALESWLAAVNTKTIFSKLNQKDLAKCWGGELGLDAKRFKEKVAPQVQMSFFIIDDFPETSKMEANIKKFSYIYLAYKQEGPEHLWHCVVLYGIKTLEKSEPLYVVMDPYVPKNMSGTVEEPKSEFFQLGNASEVYFGWDRQLSP